MNKKDYSELLSKISYRLYEARNIDKRDVLHDIFLDGDITDMKKSLSLYSASLQKRSRQFPTFYCGGTVEGRTDHFSEAQLRNVLHSPLFGRSYIETVYCQCIKCEDIFPSDHFREANPGIFSRYCKSCESEMRVPYMKNYNKNYSTALSDGYIKKVLKLTGSKITKKTIAEKREQIIKKREKKLLNSRKGIPK